MLKRLLGRAGPHGLPDAPWSNAVVRTHEEISASVDQVRSLGLPESRLPAKNWDSLAAVTSTDYYETPIDPRGYTAYGAPVRVFTRPEIVRMLEQAEEVGRRWDHST